MILESGTFPTVIVQLEGVVEGDLLVVSMSQRFPYSIVALHT